MKRAWILPLAFAATLPLVAQETKSDANAQPKPEEKTAVAQTTAAVPKPAAAEDSPLVAAAKRARRGKTTNKVVITNETLAQSNGTAHITTTEKQPPLPPVGPGTYTSEAQLIENRAKEEKARQASAAAEAEKRQKAAEAQEKHAKRAAAAEDGYDGGQGDDADEMVGSAPPPQH